MPIGTSNGDYYEDEFDKAHTEMFGVGGTYDPKTDTFVADTEPTPKKIYLARHGDTDKNKESGKSDTDAVIRGPDDTPLNEQGKADAQKLAEKVSSEPITHIVSSPVPRALETAQTVGDKLGITPTIHPGLAAWDLGDYVGKSGEEVHDKVDRLCLNHPDDRAPGGESFNEFTGRVLNAFGEIAEEHKEHEVMVVGHGSSIRVLDSYDPDTGKVDSKKYHSETGIVPPGQHKMVTIKDPSQLLSSSIQMTQPWQPSAENTFEERFQGPQPQSSLPMYWQGSENHKDFMNKNLSKNPWTRDMSPYLFPEDEMKMFMRYPNYTPELIPSYGGKEDYLRKYYNMDIEKVGDIENSIESLAQKHGVEGSKMRDIIMDVLKNPTDYISPMPGELGIMNKIPIGKEILQAMRDAGKANHEIAKELGVSTRTIINRLREFGISSEGSPIKPKQKLTPRDPNYTTNIPDWFMEEMNEDKEDKAIREWMKNQFEGAPIEPEPKFKIENTGKGMNFRTFSIKDSEGKAKADIFAQYHPEQNRLNIDVSNAEDLSHSEAKNTIGTVEGRQLLRELLKIYPDAKYLSGYRTTGARTASGKIRARMAVVPIPDSWR